MAEISQLTIARQGRLLQQKKVWVIWRAWIPETMSLWDSLFTLMLKTKNTSFFPSLSSKMLWVHHIIELPARRTTYWNFYHLQPKNVAWKHFFGNILGISAPPHSTPTFICMNLSFQNIITPRKKGKLSRTRTYYSTQILKYPNNSIFLFSSMVSSPDTARHQ